MRHKLYLRRERLNSGGYTREGYYFGHGLPLFLMEGYDEEGVPVSRHFRARDRAAAKRIIRETYPNATFYR